MENKQVMVRMREDEHHGVYGVRNFADLDSIGKKIENYVESILPRIDIEGLAEGWKLDLFIDCECTDRIAVYKKFYQKTEDKIYGISIDIPIPDETQAPYGMPLDEDGKIGRFYRKDIGLYHLLEPEYDQYVNLEQYILLSAIKAIDFVLSKGLYSDGKEIKFSRFIETPALIPAHREDVIKYKQARVRMAIEVPRLGNFVDINSINEKINTYLDSVPERINTEDLWGWGLIFRINAFCIDSIAVYKKMWTNAHGKEYIIPIAIPLPDNTQAAYGMPPGENGRSGCFLPVESDHFYALDPEYDQYVNLEQYIIESAIKAIDFGLNKGFPRDGKEIKFSRSYASELPTLGRNFVIKYKQVRSSMPIAVQRLRHFADINSINKKINAYVESILPRINIEDLSAGWRLSLITDYLCTDFVGIDKEFKCYPSFKEYGISIAIPIPDNTQAAYGMPPGEDGKIGCFHPASSNCSHLLDPEYDQYDDLEQYIVASAIKAIDFGFKNGFDCDGKKIKFQKLWRLAHNSPFISSFRDEGIFA
ncbi:hypothetical protein AXE65_08245 [Ventosimonas gracilis]|uniref:Uncharacterized protein n=1 Tax=Ventosimonas gracilis TaxID=1680762 RepID=A0A139SYC8_9GAMM|nr:Imm9 family immunity protein [Ventosimonas gracilis]KXU39484.1 hypothetical protein AXE65_08245 [Ventosimonas gracilis]